MGGFNHQFVIALCCRVCVDSLLLFNKMYIKHIYLLVFLGKLNICA